MVLLWLGLAAFSAFIAYRSFTNGSYFRGVFASFWLVMFLLSVWISFQPASPPIA